MHWSLGFKNPLGPRAPLRASCMQEAWQPKSRLLCGRMESVGVWLDMSQTKQPTTPPSCATSSRGSSFFPPTSPFFLCFELHFSGSALSTLGGCLTKFGSQPVRLRSPAQARYTESCTYLRQHWAAIANGGEFLRRRENATCAQVACTSHRNALTV